MEAGGSWPVLECEGREWALMRGKNPVSGKGLANANETKV